MPMANGAKRPCVPRLVSCWLSASTATTNLVVLVELHAKDHEEKPEGQGDLAEPGITRSDLHTIHKYGERTHTKEQFKVMKES